MSLACSENSEVIVQENWRPTKLTLGNQAIFEPNITTVTGEESVVIPNTYNDVCRLVKITGKCVQDGVPTPEEPAAIQNVGGTLTVSNADGSETVTIEIPTLYAVGDVADVVYIDFGQERAWVERAVQRFLPDGTKSGMYSSTNYTETDYGYRVYFYPLSLGMSGINTTSPNYTGIKCNYFGLYTTSHYWNMNANEIATGGGSGEYYGYFVMGFEKDFLDSYGYDTVRENVQAFWADYATKDQPIELLTVYYTPVSEELEYTALPTLPQYTAIEVDSDILPKIEITALVYQQD